ncbi:MAG: motility associated factor glycosyltransferase family protein [Planctomycetes bacterium]|nr:motility associated factor glycosyltransferase family protein [Planctomycetota bacterium]
MAARTSSNDEADSAADSTPSETAVSSTPSFNDRYLCNMAALWRADPQLASLIDDVPDERRLELSETRSGKWTASVPTPDGGRCFLHSRYDPVAEADQLAAAQVRSDCYCYVVLGFGLGYHVRSLFDALVGESILVVCEPSAETLATALTCVDLSDAFASGRLIVLTTTDKSRIHATLAPRQGLTLLGTRFVTHGPSKQIAGEFHNELSRRITEFLEFARMSLVTLVANAQITCRNIANNLSTYVTTPPIDVLENRFKGMPAVVVSAGPSLAKNVHLLAEAKGRAVICAVQTVLKPLLQRGIRPDFVTSLDFHEMSRHFFEGLGDASEVHLVAEPKATWHVIDEYPGPVSLLFNPFAEMLLGTQLAARGELKAGATVAHLAFYLARYMGCDPIVFVGQDLAFTDHVFYVPGVEIHETWRGELNRFNTMESKEFERILRNRRILNRTQDVNGAEVFTDQLLSTYREQFEADFEQTSARIINATEGGAHLQGTEAISLREVLDRFCGDPIPAQRFAYRESMGQRDRSRLRPTAEELRRRIDELKTVQTVCQEMGTLLVELKSLADDPGRFNQRLGRIDELRTIVRRSDRAYGIINSSAQLGQLKRISADQKLQAADTTAGERARQQIARDLDSVQAIADGADWTIDMLEDAVKRVDEAIERA